MVILVHRQHGPFRFGARPGTQRFPGDRRSPAPLRRRFRQSARQDHRHLRDSLCVQCGRLVVGDRGVSSLSAAAGHGAAGLQLRPAPRGRCRSHCRHRQRDAQADAGRQAAGRGRLHVFAGALDHRGPGLGGYCRNRAGAAAPHGRGARGGRRRRHPGLGAVSLRHCHRQHRGADVHLSRICARAQRRSVCGRGFRHAARQPRVSGAPLPAHVRHDPAQLAHVSAGRALRARLRYRDRDRAAGHLRGRGVEGLAACGRSWFSRHSSPRACR